MAAIKRRIMRLPLLLLLLVAALTKFEMVRADDGYEEADDEISEDEDDEDEDVNFPIIRQPATPARVGNKPPPLSQEKLAQFRADRAQKMAEMLKKKGVPDNKIHDRKDGKILLPNPDRKKKIPFRKKIKARARGYSRVKKEGGLAAVLFPGVSPEEYEEDEEIPLWVDLVESEKAQVPYQFYDLPVCEGPSAQKTAKYRKNLGAKLAGHNTQPSPYEIFVKRDMHCTVLCTVTANPRQMRKLMKMVERRYRVNVSVDSLPVLLKNSELKYAIRGYPVGFKAPGSYVGLKAGKPILFLYNHVKFVISYRESPEFEGVRIVGFEAIPVSIRHDVTKDSVNTCNAITPVENNVQTLLPITPNRGPTDITYSYEVEWVERSDIFWSNRWDVYMVGAPNDKVHTFAIMNSLLVLCVLTISVAVIMVRTLRKDILQYNEIELEEGVEESGWKLLHGDVFRPPKHFPKILCVAVGTGMQIFTTIVLVIAAATFGFVSTMNKGQTLTSVIALYVASGGVAGYTSARLSKFMDDSDWKRNTMLTATGFPGVLVAMFMVLNIFLKFEKAATAVGFFTIVLMFLLWVCISTPLVFLGAYFGFKADKISIPVKTKQVERAIPDDAGKWYIRAPYSMAFCGFLSFGSSMLEILIIMNALWLHHMYYIMGFLFIVVFVLAATCAEVSTVLTYLQFCSQDHRWWWSSFWNSASVGVYLMLYSFWFASARLQLIGFLPILTYMTYMLMLSMTLGLFCGSMGFLSSMYFTRKVYGAVKCD